MPVPVGAGVGRGCTISVSNELQRSVVIQWLLCKAHPDDEY